MNRPLIPEPTLDVSPAVDVVIHHDRAESGAAAAASVLSSSVVTHHAAGTKHVCECGVLDDEEYPVLDVRTVPHAIRHATVFGALDSIGEGAGLVLVAPHDPLPLLAQIEDRTPGRFTVSYLERGPEAWVLRFLRNEETDFSVADATRSS